jgi:osmoprotectant transport system ATP-binding protein
MFELSNISKRYGTTDAVSAIDLTIAPGKTTVLIGPSGCGKSTLLRLMIGLIRPDAGRVRFEGETLTPENAMVLRRKMGYVIQDGGLFPHLTARGNAALVARYLGWNAERIEARLRELIELTHFPFDGLDRYPAQLSGGQRQRVSLMRALMLDPDVLLMDEPLGALDRKMREQMQIEIMSLHRELGISVLYVTHDQEEALVMSNRVVVLNEGRVEQKGAPADLYERPATRFVAEFIGETNVLNGTITELSDGLCRVASGELALCGRLAAPAGRGAVVAAVVRPERVKLRRASERAESRRENACRGMVVDVIYLGKSTKHVVRLDDGRMLQALGQNDSGTDRLAVGTPVEAAWDSASLRILPETEERGGMCQRSVR